MALSATKYAYSRAHPTPAMFRTSAVPLTTAMPSVGGCQAADEEVSYLINVGDPEAASEALREHREATGCLAVIGHQAARQAAESAYT